MEYEDCRIAVGMFMAVVIGVLFGFLLGAAVLQNAEHSAAIKAGVGAWTIDAKTGATKFVYGRAD